jgi:hypothetical protein
VLLLLKNAIVWIILLIILLSVFLLVVIFGLIFLILWILWIIFVLILSVVYIIIILMFIIIVIIAWFLNSIGFVIGLTEYKSFEEIGWLLYWYLEGLYFKLVKYWKKLLDLIDFRNFKVVFVNVTRFNQRNCWRGPLISWEFEVKINNNKLIIIVIENKIWVFEVLKVNCWSLIILLLLLFLLISYFNFIIFSSLGSVSIVIPVILLIIAIMIIILLIYINKYLDHKQWSIKNILENVIMWTFPSLLLLLKTSLCKRGGRLESSSIVTVSNRIFYWLKNMIFFGIIFDSTTSYGHTFFKYIFLIYNTFFWTRGFIVLLEYWTGIYNAGHKLIHLIYYNSFQFTFVFVFITLCLTLNHTVSPSVSPSVRSGCLTQEDFHVLCLRFILFLCSNKLYLPLSSTDALDELINKFFNSPQFDDLCNNDGFDSQFSDLARSYIHNEKFKLHSCLPKKYSTE